MLIAARTRKDRKIACGCEMTEFILKHPKARISIQHKNVSLGLDTVLDHHGIVQPRYQLPDYPRLLADVGRSARFLTSDTFAALMSTRYIYIDDIPPV